MKRHQPLPSSGVQIQISLSLSFLFSHSLCLGLSQSAGKGPERGPNHHSARLFFFFFLAFSCSFSLTLRSSSSSPLLIALLIFHWQESMRREGGEEEKKKQHKLSKSHWPTSPDISLGIHISAKELEEMFSPPPQPPPIFLTTPPPSLSLSAGSHFPHIPYLILHEHYSTLYKWINALPWHNQRYRALSPLFDSGVRSVTSEL